MNKQSLETLQLKHTYTPNTKMQKMLKKVEPKKISLSPF